jgi:CBS domain-containing protein
VIAIKPLHELCAVDLMTRDVIVLTEQMSLRAAGTLLVSARSTGAPVVDDSGRCIGVLSTTDFLRLALNQEHPKQLPLPLSCSYETDCRLTDGEVVKLCTLPPGACAIQGKNGPGCTGLCICREPNSVLTDWQMVEVEKLPVDEVRCFMTPDPVTAVPETPIHTLARMMIDTHIHRVIIVDAEQKPVGIVSSTDLLALLAYPHDGPANDPSAE